MCELIKNLETIEEFLKRKNLLKEIYSETNELYEELNSYLKRKESVSLIEGVRITNYFIDFFNIVIENGIDENDLINSIEKLIESSKQWVIKVEENHFPDIGWVSNCEIIKWVRRYIGMLEYKLNEYSREEAVES